MSDTVIEPLGASRHGTVSYGRKVSVREYESAEAYIHIPFEIPLDGNEAELIANAQNAFLQGKAIVFEELGLESKLLDSGVLVEVVRQTFPNTTVASSAPEGTVASVGVSGGGPVDSKPPFDSRTRDKAEKDANDEWARARYATHPSEFWDNRPKKQAGEFSAKGPDLKHKDTGVGIWL